MCLFGGRDPEELLYWWAIGCIVFISTGVSSWIFAIRLRRRIKRDLGKAADATNLNSIETWMKVDGVEQKEHPGKEWAPESDNDDWWGRGL